MDSPWPRLPRYGRESGCKAGWGFGGGWRKPPPLPATQTHPASDAPSSNAQGDGCIPVDPASIPPARGRRCQTSLPSRANALLPPWASAQTSAATHSRIDTIFSSLNRFFFIQLPVLSLQKVYTIQWRHFGGAGHFRRPWQWSAAPCCAFHSLPTIQWMNNLGLSQQPTPELAPWSTWFKTGRLGSCSLRRPIVYVGARWGTLSEVLPSPSGIILCVYPIKYVLYLYFSFRSICRRGLVLLSIGTHHPQ